MSDDMLLKIYERLGRVDTKQDIQTALLNEHGSRLTKIEFAMERRKGVKSVFVWAWGFMIGLIGLKGG